MRSIVIHEKTKRHRYNHRGGRIFVHDSLQLEDDLVEHIYKRDPYMYVYLVWLFQRWYVLYAIHKDHLPTRFKS